MILQLPYFVCLKNSFAFHDLAPLTNLKLHFQSSTASPVAMRSSLCNGDAAFWHSPVLHASPFVALQQHDEN